MSIADYGILPPALKRFRERFPKIDVQLNELTTDAQVREIRAGRLQLGIGLAPIDEPDLVSRLCCANACCSRCPRRAGCSKPIAQPA
ncbi:MAG: LysR substrate-binding domain-containing protein [Pseudomonadota bacterium]